MSDGSQATISCGRKWNVRRVAANPAAMLGLLVLVTAVLLYGCINKPLHGIDDDTHLHDALGKPWQEWFVPGKTSGFFPVTMLSYQVDLLLFGDGRAADMERTVMTLPDGRRVPALSTAPPLFLEPIPPAWGMRLMSGLYHVLAGFVLWLFLRRLGTGDVLAAFVALVWTGHPMACESVCWVAERKNVLVALFGFSTLLAWSAGRRDSAGDSRLPDSRLQTSCWWRWPLVAFCYALAQMSKASALGILPVLVALEVLDPQRREFRVNEARCWGKSALGMLVPVAIGVAGTYAAMCSYKHSVVQHPGGSVWTALLTNTEVFSRYIKNILVPIDLSFFYGVQPVSSLSDMRPWLYGALLIAVFSGCIWAAGRTYRLLAVLGAVWFFAALGPNANLIATPFLMQDRFAYLAAPGFILLIASAALGLAERMPTQSSWLRWLSYGWPAMIVLLAVWHAPTYATVDSLVLTAVDRQPTSAVARMYATTILRNRYYRYANTGDQPNTELAQKAGKALLDCYEGIEDCPDVWQQIDRFALRVRRAEALLSLGLLNEARSALGDVPPKDLEQLPLTDAQGRPMVYGPEAHSRGYVPRTLAMAYGILAELDLRRSGASGLSDAEKLAAARQAIDEAELSFKAHERSHEATVIKGRALLWLADLYAQQGHALDTEKFYAEGLAVLKSVPEGALGFASARQIIQRVSQPVVKRPSETVSPPKGPVREPAVAGAFYPRDKEELAKMIEALLAKAPAPSEGKLRALVCPHAGYVYSGQTAAFAYKQLTGRSYKTVIILGPSHRSAFDGAYLAPVSAYKTPLGEVPLAGDRDTLAARKPLVTKPEFFTEAPAQIRDGRNADRPDSYEHSLEVQVPFLQTVLKDFSILPVVFGQVDPLEVASAIEDRLDDSTLLVASSDLSHFHPYDEAKKLDKDCLKSICELDPKALASQEACGKAPVMSLVQIAKRKGWKPKLLDYRNSGDVTGEKSSVVGYAAIAFYDRGPDTPVGDRDKSVAATFTADERVFMLKLARKALTDVVNRKPLPVPAEKDVPEKLREKKGCFVTLTTNGQLRGCIGHILPYEELYKALCDNAESAALKDTRFDPVETKELDGIKVEVSVLTAPQPLEFSSPEDLLKKLRPNVDGVVLRLGTRSATFLPQVWEQIEGKEDFLNHLSAKAGMPQAAWKQAGTQVFTYQVEAFKE
ncbi:MAG TPA: AmmeMemoRadiSam system protein B [Planctomycetota bacterium]